MADQTTNKTYEDPELDELLDDALEDFNKSDSIAKAGDEDLGASDSADNLWNTEFLQEQALLFQKNLNEMLVKSTEEGGSVDFEKVAEAAGQVLQQQSLDPDFTKSINEVLKGLSEGQEAAQNPFSADQLSSLFENVDLNAAGEEGAFMPFMQNMMQSLFSAEILLPSLKELIEKYPRWLVENAAKLEAADKEKYSKQLKLMQDVVAELEKEKPTDSADVKKERFTVILDKMTKMQDLGQPPADLIEGGQGLPNVEAGDCCLM